MSLPTMPLSYNAIDIAKLKTILDHYEGKPHHQIITDFEKELALQVGAKHLVALNSGTSAIHMALRVLGITAGDVVIAPTFTYVATINPIIYQGAEPVFIDSEKETWNMDPELLEAALKKEAEIGKKVKAILIVHTYGMPAQMNRILEIAAAWKLPVIEDAAEALGSLYKGKMAGGLGKLGIYSFNNNKVFTTYGGGALITSDEQIAKRVRFMASQARENLPYYEHKELGFNYLMGALNAAYGLSQLPGLNSIITARRNTFETYRSHLKDIQYQQELSGHYSNRWLPAFQFDNEDTKFKISTHLSSHGFETRPLWRPMHLQPQFKGYSFYGHQISERLFNSGLCLPVSSDFPPRLLDQVIDLILKNSGE